jgi:2'-deoxymugineic-acid 2'-dioxygenase / mugineic-acid 3-dioxygenase
VANRRLLRNSDSCRAALEAFTTAVRAVALRLLRLTAAGLGLDEGHFEGELSAGPVIMNVNHYVPCPDPSLTMGLAPHTVLADNGVRGLQAAAPAGNGVACPLASPTLGIGPHFGPKLKVVLDFTGP